MELILIMDEEVVTYFYIRTLKNDVVRPTVQIQTPEETSNVSVALAHRKRYLQVEQFDALQPAIHFMPRCITACQRKGVYG
jgi:hypothetical protein